MSDVIQITFFVHSTSEYNERGLLGGWYDTELSELGKKQSLELRELVKNRKFDAVFSSDLKRAYETAKAAFGGKVIVDKRLRECNYGDLTGTLGNESIDNPDEALKYINQAFPNGESYKDVEKRVKSFLKDLSKNYAGKHVAIIAHQAPQLVLEVLLNGKMWEQAIREDWRLKIPKAWQPGWEYNLTDGSRFS